MQNEYDRLNQTFFSALAQHSMLFALVLVSAVIALGAYAYTTLKHAGYEFGGPTTITVEGEAEVFARPDIATFNFGVTAEAETATAAQDESAEAMNEIIAYLTAQNIAEEDIKTTNYHLSPRYEYVREQGQTCEPGFCPPGERTLVGYSVNQTIEVKLRDTENAGDVIAGVGERGATNMSGLRFTIDDESNLRAQAREEAIQDAQEKAHALAEDLNVRIVKLRGFWENNDQPYYARNGYGGDNAMMESAAVAPDLPSGENTIISRVSVTYEVR